MYLFIPKTADTGIAGHYMLVAMTNELDASKNTTPAGGRLAMSLDVIDGNGEVTRFSATDTWQELIALVMSQGPSLKRCVGQMISITQPPMVQQLVHEVDSLTYGLHEGLRHQELLSRQLQQLREDVRGQEETCRFLSAAVMSIQKQLEEQPRLAEPLTSTPTEMKPCRHYAKKGYCLYGSRCRFAHID